MSDGLGESSSERKFVKRSMRHLAELRRRSPGSTNPGVPFPGGWFDLPERILADLGAMFFLLSITSFHRPRSIAQTIAALEPPLRLGQYYIFRSNGYPRAFITWAGLDRDAEMQFAVDHQLLQPEQWNCGDSRWVIDMGAPFGHLEQIVQMLAANKQTNRVRTLWHNKLGTRARVIEWTRANAQSEIQVSSYGRMQFKKKLHGG